MVRIKIEIDNAEGVFDKVDLVDSSGNNNIESIINVFVRAIKGLGHTESTLISELKKLEK